MSRGSGNMMTDKDIEQNDHHLAWRWLAFCGRRRFLGHGEDWLGGMGVVKEMGQAC